MRRPVQSEDLAIHRGPVSGTGEALSDEDALSILDEGVGPSGSEVPDIGVVIDPDESPAQQVLPTSTEERQEAAPAAFAWKKQHLEDWPSMRRLFGSEAPKWIVKADGLETSLRSILSRSCGYQDRDFGESSYFDTPIIVRILSRDSLIDLTLTPEDCRRSDLTLSDLLPKGVVRQYGFWAHKR